MLVFGRPSLHGAAMASHLLAQLRPTTIIVLRKKGWALDVAEAAQLANIPVQLWGALHRTPDGPVRSIVDLINSPARPDLVVALLPIDVQRTWVKILAASGIQTLVGVFPRRGPRAITWVDGRTYNGTRDTPSEKAPQEPKPSASP